MATDSHSPATDRELPPDFLDGEKFKGYERNSQGYLAGAPYAALRVDGKGFGQYTRRRGYDFPYDPKFMGAMDAAAEALLLLVDGACFAYVQSDEISVVFKPSGVLAQRNWWFGGKIQKIASVSAAKATLSFLRADERLSGPIPAAIEPLFDSRVIALPSAAEAEQYLRWRRFDAQKNSISMAAESLYSHRELHGVSSRDRAAKLQGTPLEQLPEGFFNGRLVYRTPVLSTAWDPKLGEEVVRERTKVLSSAADRKLVETVVGELLEDRRYTGDLLAGADRA